MRSDAARAGRHARFRVMGRKLDVAAEMTYTTNGLVPATIMDFGGAARGRCLGATRWNAPNTI